MTRKAAPKPVRAKQRRLSPDDRRNEFVAKTTTLKSIMGLMDKARGSTMFKDKELLSQPAHLRFALGLAYVPQERRIVQGLSVRENLRLGLVASREKKREVELIEGIARIFPRLAYVLDQGAVVHHASARELLTDNDIKERYCSV